MAATPILRIKNRFDKILLSSNIFAQLNSLPINYSPFANWSVPLIPIGETALQFTSVNIYLITIWTEDDANEDDSSVKRRLPPTRRFRSSADLSWMGNRLHGLAMSNGLLKQAIA